MISPLNLSKILIDQHEWFRTRSGGVPREIEIDRYRAHSQIVVISGVRRAGKSTLLKQLSEGFDEYLYLNLDDDRLIGASIDDLNQMIELLNELHPDVRVLFLDEVQNITGWERLVRRIHEGGYRVFLTGSNAHLLSSELGTHLTGRYVQISLWPFGFGEFCTFLGITPHPLTSVKEAEIIRAQTQYLEWGGFPEYLQSSDPDTLRRIFEDIIFRDLIARYRIREIVSLRELARYLFTNMTRETNFNALARAVGLSNPMSVRNWIGYLEECYLLSTCYQYDFSLKRQYATSRKYYGIDTGMRNAVSFRFSDDHGILLENLVYSELIRRGKEVYWVKQKGECDFLVQSQNGLTAIQVCYEITHENREREVQGLVEAMKIGNCNGLIITFRQYDQISFDNENITILPFWRWALDLI